MQEIGVYAVEGTYLLKGEFKGFVYSSSELGGSCLGLEGKDKVEFVVLLSKVFKGHPYVRFISVPSGTVHKIHPLGFVGCFYQRFQ